MSPFEFEMAAVLVEDLHDVENVVADSVENGSDVGEDSGDELAEPGEKRNRNAVTTKSPKHGPKTLDEKVQKKCAATEAKNAKKLAALRLDWKPVDQKEICFMPPALGPSDSEFAAISSKYGRFKDPQKLITELYLDMFNDTFLDAMEAEMPKTAFFFPKQGHSNWHMLRSRQHQAIAVYFRICALQDGPKRAAPGEGGIVANIQEARSFFEKFSGVPTVGVDILKKLLTHFLIRPQHSELLSAIFQTFLDCLGRYVSADEKLWHFTGSNECVRLVPSKPDQLGLWMYELCLLLEEGHPFLINFRMHDNRGGVHVTTLEIVKMWTKVLHTVGMVDDEFALEAGFRRNEKTLLAFDAYYANEATVGWLDSQKVSYSVSCKSVNFKNLVALVLPAGYNDRSAKTGDTHSIHNTKTGHVFTHHFDTQKGVGQKFNLSGGFVSSAKQADIKKHLQEPPCYVYYKYMFGDCDYFNTFLKRANWPHKRGGNGMEGMEGAHHDYVMASIALNLYHLFLTISHIEKKDFTMREFLLSLSEAIIVIAKKLVLLKL